MAQSTFAQTNIQLYGELLKAGYSPEEIGRVRDAYELALSLFSGCYRGSGKPFLAHAVGTASVLASLHAPARIVAAGLLHAAYTHGEFGNGWRGTSPERRQQLREKVGVDVEELVSRYSAFKWNAGTIPQVHERFETLEPLERDVLLVRLANDLEDRLDLGVLYCGNAAPRRDFTRSILPSCVDMAQRLGYPQLADAITQVFQQTIEADIPEVLRRGEAASYMVPPASHGLRLPVRLRHLLARLQGR